MNFWSVKNVQKYYNYKSVFISYQEISCHAALEVIRVHYLKVPIAANWKGVCLQNKSKPYSCHLKTR